MSDNVFLFNDFFDNDEDPGVEFPVIMGGRTVPFHIKRSMTVRERQKATDQSLKKHFDTTGKLVVDGVDEAVFSIEVVFSGLKSWPFTYPDGRAVPITRETIAKLPASVLDSLVTVLMNLREDQEKALVPFEKPSEDRS